MSRTNKDASAILTEGRDVPGLKPAVRSITIRALHEGYKVIDVHGGWSGFIDTVRDKEAANSNNFQHLTEEAVMHTDQTGETFLHTSRTDPARMNNADVPANLQEHYTEE